jgi:hypothetical protein
VSVAVAITAALLASTGAPAEKGVALGLFSADPDYRYTELLEEIVETGATHVSITWVWWQDDVRANDIHRVAGWSATDEQILDTLKRAKAAGLHVTAFPIVRLVKSEANEWRGRIRPTNEDAWWSSYTAFMIHALSLAKQAGADRLCIGSELLTREPMRVRWLELIERVRMRAPDLELLYSANWDHFQPVSFWDAVDVVGLTAYWELTKDPDPSVNDLVFAWSAIRPALLDWSRRTGRRFVFTEVGYPSLDGGASWPWNETRKAPVDLDEQRRAYEAFVRAWSGVEALQGTYFWNWFGFGGPEDTNYTPRKKPAADVLRRWYSSPRSG